MTDGTGRDDTVDASSLLPLKAEDEVVVEVDVVVDAGSAVFDPACCCMFFCRCQSVTDEVVARFSFDDVEKLQVCAPVPNSNQCDEVRMDIPFFFCALTPTILADVQCRTKEKLFDTPRVSMSLSCALLFLLGRLGFRRWNSHTV